MRAAVRPGREGAAPAGADPGRLDLVSGRGLAAALDGARAAYHLAPNVHPDEVGIARRVADAAAAAGLPRFVFHSVLHPEDARMPHHLRKAEAESLLRAALGERVTVLRPSAYHQNLLGQARSGVVTVPYSPDAPFAAVDLDDVAQVAADALTGDHRRTALDLAGPEVLTTRQMAEQAATSSVGRSRCMQDLGGRPGRDGPGAALPRPPATPSSRCSAPTTMVGSSATAPSWPRRSDARPRRGAPVCPVPPEPFSATADPALGLARTASRVG